MEAKRVYLGAAQAESRRDMQAEEMPTMRPERSPGPAASLEHFQYLQVTGNFVFYKDTFGAEVSSWNIHAAGPDTGDFYQGFGQTATTVKAGFPTEAYLFFNDGVLTLDFGASRDALLSGTSNISIGAFQPTVIQGQGHPLAGVDLIPLSGTLDYGGTTLDNVPLPAALPLFGSGVLALAGVAWRRRGKVS